MQPHQRRAREIQEEIGTVLWESWDPIGTRAFGGPDDEYNGYVGGVYRLLANQVEDEVLAQHLMDLEVGIVGRSILPGLSDRVARVVQRLRDIDVSLS